MFVDFENVPTADLSLVGDKAAAITLLIGEKQRRLDLELVRQIHEYAAKVTLVEVGASGRNALDLVLTWHLGRTAERHPDDAFFVVSKDKDYDPLIRHLLARGLDVIRVDAFADLPFLSRRSPAPRTPALRSPVPRRAAPIVSSPASRRPERRAASVPVAAPTMSEDRFEKLVDRLQHRTKARPVRRKTLLSHVNGFFGNHLSVSELDEIATTLEARGIIHIDANGRVEYPNSQSGAAR